MFKVLILTRKDGQVVMSVLGLFCKKFMYVKAKVVLFSIIWCSTYASSGIFPAVSQKYEYPFQQLPYNTDTFL